MKPYFAIELDDEHASTCTVLRANGGDVTAVAIGNTSLREVRISEIVQSPWVQFYFAATGSVEFEFGTGGYRRVLTAERCYLLYDPTSAMSIRAVLRPETQLACIFIPIEALHRLVLHTDVLPFLHAEGSMRAFYAEHPMHGALLMAVERMFDGMNTTQSSELMLLSRVYECLHRYVEKRDSITDITDSCPFLRDETNVERLRIAKAIVLAKFENPPPLRELARQVGMNEYQLKAGFKRVYGAPIYKYVHEHRMERARQLLEHPSTTVNEIAYAIGYSNSSHFIAAFKKRFGMTPKQFRNQEIDVEGRNGA